MILTKIVLNNTIRRVPLHDVSVAGLRKACLETFPAELAASAFAVTYQDTEGDVVTVGTNEEVKEVIDLSLKASKVPKFVVKTASAEEPKVDEPEVEEDAPEEQPEVKVPQTPLEQIATVLSDPVVVGSIQQTLASPIVADAIIASAQAYLEGGPLNCAHVAFVEQVPILQTLWSDLTREHPQVEECANKVFETNLLPEVFGFSPKPPKPVHYGVYCDGCDNSLELKAGALLNQTISDRGFIVGDRFKSTTAPDFDLCETCWSTDKFEAQSPFVRMTHPSHPPRGGFGFFQRGAGDSPNWRGPHCGPSRPPHCGPHPHGGPHPHCGPHPHPHGGPHPHCGPHPHGGPHPHCGPHGGPRRGCRGSGVNKLDAVVRDILCTGVEAFANASKTNPDLADWSDVAMAIALSLKPEVKTPEEGKPTEPKPVEPVTKTPEPVAKAPEQPVAKAPEPVPAPVADKPRETSDEWSLDPMVKWSNQLQQLEAMGFGESDKYLDILEEENGDLVKTINRIVRRMA